MNISSRKFNTKRGSGAGRARRMGFAGRLLSVLLAVCTLVTSVVIADMAFFSAEAERDPNSDGVGGELYPYISIDDAVTCNYTTSTSFTASVVVRCTNVNYFVYLKGVTFTIVSTGTYGNVSNTGTPNAPREVSTDGITGTTVGATIPAGRRSLIRYTATYDIRNRDRTVIPVATNLTAYGYGYVSTEAAYTGASGAALTNVHSGDGYRHGWSVPLYQYYVESGTSISATTRTYVNHNAGAIIMRISSGTAPNSFSLASPIAWPVNNDINYYLNEDEYETETNNNFIVLSQPNTSGFWSFNVYFDPKEDNNPHVTKNVQVAWRLAADINKTKALCDYVLAKCLQPSYYNSDGWTQFLAGLEEVETAMRIPSCSPSSTGWSTYINACQAIAGYTISSLSTPNSHNLAGGLWGLTYRDYTLSYNINVTNAAEVSVYNNSLDPVTAQIYTPLTIQSSIYGTSASEHTFFRTGYTFGGWSLSNLADENTVPDYRGGDTLVLTRNTTLYAIWIPNPHTVTYHSGIYAMGSEVVERQVIYSGETWILIGRPDGWTRDGLRFNGWYTASSGGTYLPLNSDQGAWPASRGDIELYAQWTPGQYYVRYASNDNGNTVQYVNQDPNNGNQPYPDSNPDGVSFTQTYICNSIDNRLAANRFTKAGYNFIGWSTNPSATTALYQPGDSSTLSQIDGYTVTLYPVWQAKTYTLVFNYTGVMHTPDDGMPDFAVITFGRPLFQADYYQGMPSTTFTQLDPTWTWTGTINVSETGWPTATKMHAIGSAQTPKRSFVEWNDINPLQQVIGNSIYPQTLVDSSITFSQNNTWLAQGTEGVYNIYSRWITGEFLVMFDYNGGYGTEVGRNVAQGNPYSHTDSGIRTLPTATRPGYSFAGWFTDTSFTTQIYDNSVKTSPNAEVLYAKWDSNMVYVEFVPNGADIEWTRNSMYQAYRNNADYSNLVWDTGSFLNASVLAISEDDTTLAIPPCVFQKAGSVFIGWAVAADGAVMYADGENFDTIVKLTELISHAQQVNNRQLISLYAVYTSNSYTLTFDTCGGILFQGRTYNMPDGSTFVLPPNPDSKLVVFGEDYQATANSEATYWPDAGAIPEGYPADPDPAPTRGNYVFGGWWTTPEPEEGEPDTGVQVQGASTLPDTSGKVKIASDHTLYARWIPESYNFRLSANGGRFRLGGNDYEHFDLTARFGSTYAEFSITIEGLEYRLWDSNYAPRREGFVFLGWYRAPEPTGQPNDTPLLGNAVVTGALNGSTIYARWSANTYDIVFNYSVPGVPETNHVETRPYVGSVVSGKSFTSESSSYMDVTGYPTEFPTQTLIEDPNYLMSEELLFYGNQRYCAHINQLYDLVSKDPATGEETLTVTIKFVHGTEQQDITFGPYNCRVGDNSPNNEYDYNIILDCGQPHEDGSPECSIICTPHEYWYNDETEGPTSRTIYTYKYIDALCDCCDVTFDEATGEGSCTVAYQHNTIYSGKQLVGWMRYGYGDVIYTTAAMATRFADALAGKTVYTGVPEYTPGAELDGTWWGEDGAEVILYAVWTDETEIPFSVEHYKARKIMDGNTTLADVNNAELALTTIALGHLGENADSTIYSVHTMSPYARNFNVTSEVGMSAYVESDGSTVIKAYYTRYDYNIFFITHGNVAPGTVGSGATYPEIIIDRRQANQGDLYADIIHYSNLAVDTASYQGHIIYFNNHFLNNTTQTGFISYADLLKTSNYYANYTSLSPLPNTANRMYFRWKFRIWDGYSPSWWTQNGWVHGGGSHINSGPVWNAGISNNNYSQSADEVDWGRQIRESDTVASLPGGEKQFYESNLNLYLRWLPDHVEVEDAGIVEGARYDYMNIYDTHEASVRSYESFTAVYNLSNTSNRGANSINFTLNNGNDINTSTLDDSNAPARLYLDGGRTFPAGTKITMLAVHYDTSELINDPEYVGSLFDAGEDFSLTPTDPLVFDYTCASDKDEVYLSEITSTPLNVYYDRTRVVETPTGTQTVRTDKSLRLMFIVELPGDAADIEAAAVKLEVTSNNGVDCQYDDVVGPVTTVSSSDDVLVSTVDDSGEIVILRQGSPTLNFSREVYEFDAVPIKILHSGETYTLQVDFSGSPSPRQTAGAVIYLQHETAEGSNIYVDDAYYVASSSGTIVNIGELLPNVNYRAWAELYVCNNVTYSDGFPRGGTLVDTVPPVDGVIFKQIAFEDLNFIVSVNPEYSSPTSRLLSEPGQMIEFDVEKPENYAVSVRVLKKDEGSGQYFENLDGQLDYFIPVTGTSGYASFATDYSVNDGAYRLEYTLFDQFGNEIAKMHSSFIVDM